MSRFAFGVLFHVTRADPGLSGYPTLEYLYKDATPAGRVARSARPHLSCKCQAEKIKVYKDRWVAPPLCKQGLRLKFHMITVIVTRSPIALAPVESILTLLALSVPEISACM